jgi:hypothetical protein
VRVFLKKTENSIATICLRWSSGSIVVFNVVLPGAKSGRPLLHGPETECIQAITFHKFGSDLLIPFPAKNEISDDRSLLQQEQHWKNDKRPEMWTGESEDMSKNSRQ